MAGMEGNDNTKTPDTTHFSADPSRFGFNATEQREVVNKFSQGKSSDVSSLQLDNNEDSNHQVKRIGQPHNWYSETKTSYSLPSESAITGANVVEPALKAGWRTQYKQA